MRIPILLLAMLISLPGSSSPADEAAPPALETGTITTRVTWGKAPPGEYRYTRHGQRLRIEDTRKSLPTPPYNVIDLESGETTVVFPHNGTSTRFPAAPDKASPTAPREEVPAPAAPPAGFDPPLPSPLPPGNPDPASPRASPSVPTGTPDQPSLPSPPHGLRVLGRNVPGTGSLPPMPAMPVPASVSPVLEITSETREIHGYPCSLYTLTSSRNETLRVWACASLEFPLLPLLTEPPRHGERRELAEAWPEILREKGLFPFLATLSKENREIYRFEVTSVSAGPVDDNALTIPDGLREFPSLDPNRTGRETGFPD